MIPSACLVSFNGYFPWIALSREKMCWSDSTSNNLLTVLSSYAKFEAKVLFSQEGEG